MFNEAEFYCFYIKSKTIILSCHDILILPFEGQNDTLTKSSPQKKEINTGIKNTNSSNGRLAERKTISRPTGKLMTTNIGIKETLNPTQKKTNSGQESVLSSEADDFTFEQLEHVWKEYSLGVKRERKDKLYSTLVSSKLSMNSDYQISLEIVNTVQANDLDREKGAILNFIRKKLNNYSIGLNYKLVEQTKKQVLDNKGLFDKMAEENSSLNKFRKLFNLDIEF